MEPQKRRCSAICNHIVHDSQLVQSSTDARVEFAFPFLPPQQPFELRNKVYLVTRWDDIKTVLGHPNTSAKNRFQQLVSKADNYENGKYQTLEEHFHEWLIFQDGVFTSCKI